MKITTTRKLTKTESSNRSRGARRKEVRNSPLTFVGIDTEGSGKGSDHRPVLVSCGTAYISDANGLDWKRVFSFLYEQFQSGGYVFGGFYLSYDFTQWLRSLPENRARMLLTPAGKAARTTGIPGAPPYPVYAGDWEFDILGTKRLRIRPTGEQRWMYICDSGPFFQCSFLRAINPEKWTDPIVTPAEYERIKEGKDYRSEAVLDDQMIEYQQLEVEVWSRLMEALQEGLNHMGIRLTPKQWFGPGQVAQEWLKMQDVPRAKDLPDFIPEWMLEAAQSTYFGGWFEIFAHGHIPGITYEYDINSAYPYILAKLPCLRHGRYSKGEGKPEMADGTLCIVRGIARTIRTDIVPDVSRVGRDWPIGAMLHRDKRGRIFRPQVTAGYWWLHELEAAQRAGTVNEVEYLEWWAYEPCDCPPPLASIAELYYERQRVDKNSVLGKAIRLLINSVYGKFAQSIGDPMFGNAIYASLITAGCRTMILDAIATHPSGVKSVVMVATDGVYFLDKHPGLPLTSELGDWEESIHENMTLYKPGMYWDDAARERMKDGKAPEFKSRGINAQDFSTVIGEVDDIFRSWPKRNKDGSCNDMTYRPQWHKKGKGWPQVQFKAHFSMISMTQAVQEGWDWKRAGEVSNDVTLKQSAWHGMKRESLWYDPERDIYRSAPLHTIWQMASGPMYLTSTPYDKRFGMDSPWTDLALEELGITPDGEVGASIADALFGSR